MFTCSRILIFFGAVIAYPSCAGAFFWSSSETSKSQQPFHAYPITYYHQRMYQGAPLQQSYNGGDQQQPPPVQIPAIPIQVPLQAQLSPANNVHNVQLVPCLCPISSDLDYDRGQDSGNPFIGQIKNAQD